MKTPPSRSMRTYLIIITVVAICLVAISIGIGYAIGSAVKTKEYEDGQRPKGNSESPITAKSIMEKNQELYKKAVAEVSTENLRDNLRSVSFPLIEMQRLFKCLL